MPELPEVQTIVTDLQKIVGDSFVGFFSHWPKALKKTDPKAFTKLISQKKITAIERIGKNIFLTLEKKDVVGIHLKMTGQLLLMDKPTWEAKSSANKHLHHAFFLKKNGVLAFSDVRKFATITLYDSQTLSELKAGLGLDPVQGLFTLATFTDALALRPLRAIKEVLMDQKIIVGIGNIYASEILFKAGIQPNRATNSLDQKEKAVLFKAVSSILAKALTLRGTSVSDYRDASGQRGQFQNYLKVYKKHTQPCQKCATIIAKSIIAQRSTFYCPSCQK